jgi:ureidoglycolate lyase
MPQSIPAPHIKIKLEHLNRASFSPFGTVIQNPAHNTSDPNPSSSGSKKQPQLKVTQANQGSALKYIDISHLTNHYGSARSKKPARAVMNMFVCKPRTLRSRRAGRENIVTDQVTGVEVEKVFDVEILERHPYTPQTFVPVGLARDDVKTKYLVVVAPTLPMPASGDGMISKARKVLSTWASSPSQESGIDPVVPKPKGPGLPDLRNLRAFLADGSQAVTYGPGTWHAPMVVIGEKPIEFVVIQYANAVADEDCQEILLKGKDGGGVSVVVEVIPESSKPLRAKL